jgi:protein-L-isoaspartate(D-aspartate) O-methyltransferase
MTITAESAPTQAARQSEVMRKAMIDSQLRTSGINDPFVLTAMMRIAREDYVPSAMKSAAYIDRAIPLGKDRWLAAPVVHGMMLTEAAPSHTDTALLIGEARGYLEALLKPLAGKLETVDPSAFGPTGLGVIAPSASDPSAYAGRFTLIVIDGAIEHLPDSLVAHLVEGGRVVTGLVERGVTRLAVGRKAAGAVALLPLADLGIPVLAEFAAPKRWSF